MRNGRGWRCWLALCAVAGGLGCEAPASLDPIPAGVLYFPTGMFHAPGAVPGDPGYLYVVSSNFDRRFRAGKVTGISLAGLMLPPIGAVTGEPLALESLGTIDEREVASLGGELAGHVSGGRVRLLVPSRAEGSLFQALDAEGERLSCPGGDPVDCSVGAPSLVANERTATGVPRAPDPLGVAISRDGPLEAYVTHLSLADSPTLSGKGYTGYLVKVDPYAPQVTDDSFIDIGRGSSTAVAVGRRYAFVAGHLSLPLRLVDRVKTIDGRPIVQSVGLPFPATDARAVALSSTGQRLYLLTRPDALLVMDIPDPESDFPTLKLVRTQLGLAGASQLQLIERPGRGNLVVVSSIGTGALDAPTASQGTVLVYDEDSGQIVAQRAGAGAQPHGLAIQREGQGARIFVGLFGEGRLAVFDMPDVSRPEALRLVARVGRAQDCLTDERNPQACEVVQ